MKPIDALQRAVEQVLTEKEQAWLATKSAQGQQATLIAFVAAPRFVTRRPVAGAALTQLAGAVPGWQPDTWTADRLARVYLLAGLPDSDQPAYIQAIENLFGTAELQELVALYTALPVLSYPDHWLYRATEAVRSNMGPVFEAIAFFNPYPKQHFAQPAWNQLILKCIFNDKPMHLIDGLMPRANDELAHNLSDLAHERWAAGRQLPAQAWRLVSSFVDDVIFEDIQTLFRSPDVLNQQAAALVCSETNYEPARQLLTQHPSLQQAVMDGSLTWQNLEVYS